MDLARDICRTELEKYLTSTGRLKTGGPLKKAMDDVQSLRDKCVDLQGKSNQLRDALDRRRELHQTLSDLNDPEQIKRRRKRIDEAQNELSAARVYNEKYERAKETERKIVAELHRTSDMHGNLQGNIQELAAARKELELLENAERSARDLAGVARAELTTAEHARSSAKENDEAAAKLLKAVLEREAAVSTAELSKGLEKNLRTAEGHRQEAESRASKAKAEITAKALAPIEQLNSKLDILRKTRELESAFVRMNYRPDRTGGVNLQDGTELLDRTAMPIPDGATLVLDGLGSLEIDPGKAAKRGELERLEAELATVLKGAGHDTVESAMGSAQRRREAEQGERDAKAALKAVAPDGIEALRNRLAKMPQSTDLNDDLPSREAAEDIAARARQELAKADVELAGRRERFDQMKEKAAIAIEKVRGASSRVGRAERPLAAFENPEDELSRLEARETSLKIQLSEAGRASSSLSEKAPDLEVVEAKLTRARSALERIESERAQIQSELSALDERIELRAGEAVEEELADANSLLEAAEQQLSALQFEVEVLQRLKAELETASSTARDQYVRPVVDELQPLVRILWPEAELHLDAENVLPGSLTRGGTHEDFDVLSGGTKEQIALLVRLAFARLLARGGSPAPVILDDAIVFSDDDRIEHMFDALTKQAKDLQIIAFSCRQRAFRELGGKSLAIVSAS